MSLPCDESLPVTHYILNTKTQRPRPSTQHSPSLLFQTLCGSYPRHPEQSPRQSRCSVNTGPFPSTQLRTVTPRLQWPRLSFPLPTEITTTSPVKCPPTPRCSSRPQRCHIIACFLAHAWRYFLSLDKFPKCRDHLLLFSTKQWTKHHAVAQIMYKRRIINNPIWQKRNFNKTFSEN